jgi:hypothetical protein
MVGSDFQITIYQWSRFLDWRGDHYPFLFNLVGLDCRVEVLASSTFVLVLDFEAL